MARRAESIDLPLELVGDFSPDWERSTLEKACSLVTDGTHDSPKMSTTGFPLVTGKCITGGRVDLNEAYLISEADHRAVIARSRPEFGDILFANIGNSVGELARVETNAEFSIKNVALFKPGAQLDSRFLKYYLLSPLVQTYIRGTTFGSAQPFIGLATLRAFPIPLPPVSEQRAIARILGTPDDKIELNRRMNDTLETIARVLFKSWFVDFDPVRAKAEGRDPGLPKHIADLFPDSFEDSELGEIPKGWEVKPLDAMARFLNGLALQNYPPTGERSLPVIKISQLRAGTTEGADRASADLEPDYIVENGDILFSWSGSLECVIWAAGPGALNQHLFKVTSDQYPKWLCYLGVYHHLKDFRHIAAGKATTMGHIQRHHLSDAKLAIPSPALLTAMDGVFAPIFESTLRRAVEAHTLATLRNALLPKLITGELRIGAVERVQAAV